VYANGFWSAAQSLQIPFTQFQLENGLRVVLSEDHAAPVVAVVVYYDVGSRNEVKGRSGFAHLFEHMMFQGSENVSKAQHFQYVENNGGFLNASTHTDYTDYYNFLPANQLELALWLESDRMRSLKVTAVNLKNQKDAVKEEKRLSVDNQAYSPALTKMDEAIFRNWANAHSTIGSMADLDAATLKDVKDFFRIYYAPNNAVLTIAGDIDPTKTENLVRKYFDSIPRQPAPPPVNVTEPFETVLPKTVSEDPHAEVPALAIAWKLPPRRSPDSYAIEMAKAVLFDGESSRLYQELVKKKKLALEVNAMMDDRRGPSALTLLTLHKPEVKPDEVQAIVEAELERLKTEGVSDAELNKVKNLYRLAQYLSGSEGEYTSLQTALGRALTFAEYTLFDGDPSLINTELDHYLAVTPAQVKEAARKYFGTANRTILHIKPATKSTEGKQINHR
jgi:predicted Zn-dependent peptidase